MFSRATRQSLLGFRRARGQLPPRRFYSSTARKQEVQASPIAAGMAGGVVTLVGVYSWYYFSGTRELIQKAEKTADTVESIKARIKAKNPTPIGVTPLIRSMSRDYVGVIPGVGPMADSFFDELEEIEERHKEEASRILYAALGELQDVFSSGEMNEETGRKASEVLLRRGIELRKLSNDLGQEILEKNPQLRKQLQGGMGQLKQLGRRYGPEAQKIVNDTYRRVQEITNQGVNPSSIAKISTMVDERTQQIKKLGEKLADREWEEGSKEAKGRLEKLPQTREILEENRDKLKALVASGEAATSGAVREVFRQVKRLASEGESTENLEKFKRFIDEVKRSGPPGDSASSGPPSGSTSGGGDPGWQSSASRVEEYLRTIPGGEKALQEPPILIEIIDLGKNQGPEAEKIIEETIEEIMQVLQKRLKEVKDMASKE